MKEQYLQKLSNHFLKKIAIDIEVDKEVDNFNELSKNELISEIMKRFTIYKDYKKKEKYTIKEQLGSTGKEGKTYLVVDKKGNEYAMKQFNPNKSSNNIKKEVEFGKLASKYGISPKIIDVNYSQKYIIMEKLDRTFFDVYKEKKGIISNDLQHNIVKVVNLLDKIGIFHGDPNPANFMIKNGRVYIIDFGFSKKINEDLIKQYGKNPNNTFMILGLLLKLKETFGDIPKNEILLKEISDRQKGVFQL